MKKEMLINVLQPEESRIAIVEDAQLEELYVERTSQESHVGNIYKGRIVNIEPSIQAAFVDFGIGRNGFLHVSDVDPQYYRRGNNGVPSAHREPGDIKSPTGTDRRGRRTDSRRSLGRTRVKPPIQEIFRRGSEVLVQVIKEGIGTKGPTLSTYISIPGRYLVLMPGLGRVGVSRKIADEETRKKLRDVMAELDPPKGLGFIIRTAGIDRSKKDLSRDLAYLLRLWKVVVRRLKRCRAPSEIYRESDLITRTIRDIFTGEVDHIWIDEPEAFERAREFLKIVMPRYVNRLKLYGEREPLFHKYRLEEEIAQIQSRIVPLKNGGSIVIDQTEALVAIDVNSGSFRADNSAEETAYQINLRAAKEIARQLRLRDLGGVIINDFIDMREEKHRRAVERTLRDSVRRDRARTKILRMSALGVIEMTRQRIRSSLRSSVYRQCPYCDGRGLVKTAETMSIEVIRLLQLAAHNEHITRVSVGVSAEVADYLNNRKRKETVRLEEGGGMRIDIDSENGVPPEYLRFQCFDANGNEVKLSGTGMVFSSAPQPPQASAAIRESSGRRRAAGKPVRSGASSESSDALSD